MKTIEERITSLERRSRIHRNLLLAFGVIILISVTLSSNGRNNLKVKSIEVVNHEGKTLFQVDQRYMGGRLRLFNLDGKTVFELDSLSSGAHLILSNDDGKGHLSFLSGGSVGKKFWITADVPLDIAYPGIDTTSGVIRKWPIANIMPPREDEPSQ